MEHIGIDLGGRESQICVRAPDGTIVEEGRVGTASLGAYLESRPQSRVVMESCAEAFMIASHARDAGHDPRVVPATLVRSLGVGARGIKTDKRDARIQSEVSCRIDLPGVHIPSAAAQELRSSLQMRELLVRVRTQLINSVRGYLRTQVLSVRGRGGTRVFLHRVRDCLSKALGAVPPFVERQLKLLELVGEQISEANKELKLLTQAHPVCRRLMTAPYVGPVTAARFVAAIDDISRFPSAHSLESYLGLTPGENSSSERQRRTGITKAGPASARACLVQCGWGILRMGTDPFHHWGVQIASRRPKQVAVCAVARKLAGILYAMWRDGRDYDARLAAKLPA